MGKKVSLIGIGMDGCMTLTRQAENAVEKAELLIGAERMLEPFKVLGKHIISEYRSEKIAGWINESRVQNIAVLMSGDCGFYSGAQNLIPFLDGYETEVIPGISTPAYLCSKLNISWNDVNFVSLHGRNANAAREVSSHEKTFFLLGGDVTAGQLCSHLCRYGLADADIYIGASLAMEGERIYSGKAVEFKEIETDRLCAVMAVNPGYEKSLRTGIPDVRFLRGGVPMTKSEVRSVLISKLEIERNDVCWDIGCGTGSVSVEMALQCPKGKVFAVDRNSEAAELTDKNSRRFACDNIDIVCADAKDTIEKLPAPDCVFIGGSGGSLERIVECAVRKNNNTKLAATAVSLETLSECARIFNDVGLEYEMVQIAVTRTRRIGSHTMFYAENPVFIIQRKMI